jgi:hypothetical protein
MIVKTDILKKCYTENQANVENPMRKRFLKIATLTLKIFSKINELWKQ